MLDRGNRLAVDGWWRRARAAPGPGDRTTLQQVEPPSGERPLDVARGSVDLLGPARERGELRDVVVAQADLLAPLPHDRLVVRAAVGRGPDRDLLEPRRALEHLAGRRDAEAVGDDPSGDHRLAESPRGLDD